MFIRYNFHPNYTNYTTPVIVISKKLFSLILIGLASIAVGSVCTLLHLPIHQAIIIFLGTWLLLITLFEVSQAYQSPLRGSPDHK